MLSMMFMIFFYFENALPRERVSLDSWRTNPQRQGRDWHWAAHRRRSMPCDRRSVIGAETTAIQMPPIVHRASRPDASHRPHASDGERPGTDDATPAHDPAQTTWTTCRR